MRMKKSRAFTLAEVLVVIGMIGVIAALTIPNLQSDTLTQEYLTRYKKTEASLQNALSLARIKYGDNPAAWGDISSKAKKIYQYLNWSSSCGLDENGLCFSTSNVLAISGSQKISAIGKDKEAYKITLNDNSSMAFKYVVNENATTNFYVFVDLDGPNSGYNTLGQDIFGFEISSEGKLDFTNTANIVSNCRALSNYTDCSTWIHKTGNNEYLNCSTVTLASPTCR